MSLLPAFTDPQFFADPYPAYRQLHAQGVGGWDEERQMWLVWGYAEALDALRSPRLSVEGRPRDARRRARPEPESDIAVGRRHAVQCRRGGSARWKRP
jgi:cytochrome P450